MGCVLGYFRASAALISGLPGFSPTDFASLFLLFGFLSALTSHWLTDVFMLIWGNKIEAEFSVANATVEMQEHVFE